MCTMCMYSRSQLIITFCLYGLDQGGTHALNELGRVYSYKDRGYEPADTQRAIAFTDMSWYDAIGSYVSTHAMRACLHGR